MNKIFGVIGGDRRQAELVRLLEADGHTVLTYGVGGTGPTDAEALERAASAEVVVLPLPLCREMGLRQLRRNLPCHRGPVSPLGGRSYCWRDR